MTAVLSVCFAVLVVSMGIVLVRLERGPSNLDRAVALDVITAASVGIVVVLMAITGRVDLLPLLVVLASVGFIGSTTIARFSRAESIGESQLLSAEEAARADEIELADDDEPVHADADQDDSGVATDGFDLQEETR